jgi:hypothetical protein
MLDQNLHTLNCKKSKFVLFGSNSRLKSISIHVNLPKGGSRISRMLAKNFVAEHLGGGGGGAFYGRLSEVIFVLFYEKMLREK